MKKLYRSRDNQRLAGICGGLSEIFDVDANLLRLGLVFLALFTWVVPLTLTYVAAWVLLPEGPDKD